MSDRELSEIDELVEIENRTNSDGSVEVTIEEWNKVSSSVVEVKFQLIDTVKSEKMAWPEAGSSFEDNKFYRLVKSCGLDMRNADLLKGSDATAVKSGASWELYIPRETNNISKLLDKITNAATWLINHNWKEIIISTFWMMAVLVLMIGALGVV